MKPIRLAIAQAVTRFAPPIVAGRLGQLIYPRRLGRRDRYPFTVRAQTGSMFSGDTADFVAFPFGIYGYNDYRLWAIAIALCQPGDTIIEIGANIGTETVGFADVVGERGRVFAFEPFPANLAKLQATLALRSYPNVTVLPLALGETTGKVRFVEPTCDNSGVGQILRTQTTDRPVIEVQCVTLDSLAERIGPASLISMDAEDSERYILEGARAYLRRHHPAVVVEAHKQVRSALYDIIKSLDYLPFALERFGLRSVDLRREESRNWLCLPSACADAIGRVHRIIRRCVLMPCIPGLNPIARSWRT